MKATKLTDKILLIEFPTRKEMTLTMFRIQEFYEGKEGIKGCYFTPDQFIDAYSDEKGDIDYFSYWDGFNVPTDIIFDFAKKFTMPEMGRVGLSIRECNIIKEIYENIQEQSGYLITIVEGDEITLKHEMAHAYFFTDAEYRGAALVILSSIPLVIREKLRQALLKSDYCEEVVNDEIQAYLTAYDKEEWAELFPDIAEGEIKEYSAKLQVLLVNKREKVKWQSV